jgi:adenylate cyclase
LTEPRNAAFLSYASQDAVAAARICASLRDAGIEVWFDQRELRGGEAWDHHIRHQIQDCALFIPIVSEHTQTRAEGYFRLEWDLADQRSHMIARSKAFILPVCVDGTPESGAEVPDSFLKVQWTRLPGGETSAAFCERISMLLAGRTERARAQVGSTPPVPTVSAHKSRRWMIAATAGVLLAIIGGWSAWRLTQPKHNGTTPAPSVAAVPEKSIGVLPFVNMSVDKEQEYFSDGLTEELLDLLSRVPDLKVPARTSSFYFKGKQVTVAEIAKALNVANVLEGSVRRSGQTIRVTVQLIRADNGYHIWSNSYDRSAKDVFKVQDDIASAVVDALKLKLSSVHQMPSRGTSSTEAYYQFLMGRQLYVSASGKDSLLRSIDAYRQSISLDPKYAAAYAGLAVSEATFADLYGNSAGLKRAAVAANEAIALAPEEADGYAARGILRYYWDWNWAGAQADFTRALALDPADADIQAEYGRLLSSLGRLPEAIVALKKATVLDPLSSAAWASLGSKLASSRDFAAAREAARRALEIQPESSVNRGILGNIQLFEGEPKEALATFKIVNEEPFRLPGIAMAEHSLGNRMASQQALDDLIAKRKDISAYEIAEVYAWRGEKDLAFDWLERAYNQRDGGIAVIAVDPFLAHVRGDRRWTALLRKLKLPET